MSMNIYGPGRDSHLGSGRHHIIFDKAGPPFFFSSCKLMMLYGPHVRDLLQARLNSEAIKNQFEF